MSAFPTIESLANAEEETVLKLWEGLGYYSRARNLQKAAKLIVSSFGGIVPDNPEDLSTLPGIGEYTRNAILAIAYQKPYIAVDGNLLRVYARLESKRFYEITQALKEQANRFFQKAFPLPSPGDFNQALMDLGELVCLPNGNPLCQVCPCVSFCKAHQKGNEASYPGKRAKKEKKSEDIDVFLLEKDGKYAIQKRGDNGLLAGLYQFPNLAKRTSKEERIAWLKSFGLGAINEEAVGEAKHIFTHLVWNMKGYRIQVSGDSPDFLFVSINEMKEKYSLPSAFSYFLKKLD